MDFVVDECQTLGAVINRKWIILIFMFLVTPSLAHSDALLPRLGHEIAPVLTFAFKTFFARERPPLATRLALVDGFSYPSGHSVSAACIYFSLAIIAARANGSRPRRVFMIGFFLFLVFAIGLSRMYLGVHYFSDVVAGFTVGFACSSLVFATAAHFRTNVKNSQLNS